MTGIKMKTVKVWEKIIVINERERVGEHGEKEKKSEKTG